jgi:hypothetical protein
MIEIQVQVRHACSEPEPEALIYGVICPECFVTSIRKNRHIDHQPIVY